MNKEVKFLLSDSQSNVFCKLYSHIVRPVISFGLMVKRIIGIKCKIISVDSRVWEGCRLII